jgi:hypothetical protein
MADPSDEKLTPSNPDDLAAALAFALKFEGRKRWHDADAFMADIVAKRLVRHLERAGYVVICSAVTRRLVEALSGSNRRARRLRRRGQRRRATSAAC